MKMNPAIKAKWVAALRSGKYKQGKKTLHSPELGTFCCLGVLSELYRKECGGEWEERISTGLEAHDSALPGRAVVKWAGLDEEEHGPGRNPQISIEGVTAGLAAHNDGDFVAPRTFAEIADAIEAQL